MAKVSPSAIADGARIHAQGAGGAGRDWVAFYHALVPRLASLRATGREYDSPDSEPASPRGEPAFLAKVAPRRESAAFTQGGWRGVEDASQRAEAMARELLAEEEREKRAKAQAGKGRG